MLSLPTWFRTGWQTAWKRRRECGPGPRPRRWNCQRLSRHWLPWPGVSLEGPEQASSALTHATCHTGLGRRPGSLGPPRVQQGSLGAAPAPERAVPRLSESHRSLIRASSRGSKGNESRRSGLKGRWNGGRRQSWRKGGCTEGGSPGHVEGWQIMCFGVEG